MQIVNVSLMTVDKCQLRNVQILAICEMLKSNLILWVEYYAHIR